MTETVKQRRIVLKPGESYVLQPEDIENPPIVECAPMKYAKQEQTEREAFEAWWKREDTAGLSEACRMSAWNGWLAACAWQRERDAVACDEIECLSKPLREALVANVEDAYKGQNVNAAETQYKVGSDYWQGCSDGAGSCARAIRAQGERR